MQSKTVWSAEENLESLAKNPPLGFFERLQPKFVREAKEIFREQGLRGVIAQYGWKLFAVFFLYYLVRDSILYLLLPYLIARGLF